MILKLKNTDFQTLLTSEGLRALDERFTTYLSTENAELAAQLHAYRQGEIQTQHAISELIIACAPILENFIATLFDIEAAVLQLKFNATYHDPIFVFKDYYLQQAKRLAKTVTDLSVFDALNNWLFEQIEPQVDMELAVALFGVRLLKNSEVCKPEIERLVQWCVLVQQTDAGKKIIRHWRGFHLPQKTHYENLVPMIPVENDPYARFEGPQKTRREREGFALTDERMPLRAVLDEIHYCVYCHKTEGDFCSKGFPVKKNNPELGLKINPAGDVLTGCPLEEKISEMHTVKKSGYGIGALAVVTIDNPMCAVTGHRICNDCMKACIYQKQDPVNIPQIETRVLTDVLALPWGIEIYDLLIRWNPLRQTQIFMKPYNGTNVLVMGMGPAGFTLAHHLLMEGCAVVGFDGLKIEPLPKEYLSQPIKDFNTIKESLDDRIMTGFGGVAEYGITVRWDKNFLKLIYIHLSRIPYFQVFGDARFGGTITVENAWALGFDHVALAVGAGLPNALRIPNSLAPGMRQANDFLMALQLTGAIKKSSLANLQVRLPAVVIGGGLTGIDTATEVQAYYITQVEKIHQRYHVLKSHYGRDYFHAQFDTESLLILNEFLDHAEKIIAEKHNAQLEKRDAQLNRLIREWGGVTIVYRKSIQESPAYQRNHEEIIKALEEGIYYAEGLEPRAVILDEYGAASALTCRWRIQDEEGNWIFSNEEQTLPAKSIFVATGAKPNIAYEFEHRGTFVKHSGAYQCYESKEKEVTPVTETGHVKTPYFGAFTSYQQKDYRVSFIGDTHPVFHGSVVKAIACAKRSYPKIMDVLPRDAVDNSFEKYKTFRQKIQDLFSATIISIMRHTHNIIELTVRAPMAAKKFHPGQFYRIQNYEAFAQIVGDTKLQTETLSALGIYDHAHPDQLSFFIAEKGASSKVISTLTNGQPISIMGPTGVKTKIPETPQTILMIGDLMAIFYLLSVGPALKRAGCHIVFVVACKQEHQCAKDRIAALASEIIFCDEENQIVDILLMMPMSHCETIFVIGSAHLLKTMQNARNTVLKSHFHANAKFTASVYGSMQCMLKGVCAQCLQWQVDPITGQRTKAVYACSWQHQPIEIIDIDHISDRLSQNKTQEVLTNLWLEYLFWTQTLTRVVSSN